jgi:hypothetical protein
METYEFRGKIKLLTPLSHNSDENFGTDVVFRKTKYKVNDDFEEIPFLSGNAIRGVLRRLGAQDFIDMLGLEKLDEKLYYILFAGGALEKADDSLEVAKIKEMRLNIPLLSLFGTAFVSRIVQGKMKVGIGTLICKETNTFTGENSDRSFYEFLDEIFYTRRDDLEDKESEAKQQMKYSGEVLIPGTLLSHFFYLNNITSLELSCFSRIIELFNKKSFLGGKSSIGHGLVELVYDWDLCSKEYLEFVKDNKRVIRAYLYECLQ